MHLQRRNLLSLAGVTVFSILAFGSVPEPSEEQKAAMEAERQADRAALAQFQATLGQVHTRLSAASPAALPEVACDGSALSAAAEAEKTGKASPMGVRVAYLPFLKRFADNSPATYASDEAPFTWITDSTFRGHFDTHPDQRDASAVNDTAERVAQTFLPERYLAVVVPDPEAENQMPRGEADGFFGGIMVGVVELIDLRTGEAACRTRIAVESSDEITWREGGATGETYDEALVADFQDNFEEAVGKAVPSPLRVTTSYGHMLR